MANSTALTLVTPQHEQESREIVAWSKAVEITTAEMYQEVAEKAKIIKRMQVLIKEDFEEAISRAYKTHKEILRQRDSHLGPLTQAKQIVDKKLSLWRGEQQRKQREQEERERVETLRRLEDERLAQAQAVKDAGDAELAEAVLNEPIFVPAVTKSEPAVPKIEGMAYREYWTFEIVQPEIVPRQFLIPDVKAIGAIVRAQKAATNIPGVRVFSKTPPAY